MLKVYNRQGSDVLLEKMEVDLSEGRRAALLLSSAKGYLLPQRISGIELSNAGRTLENIKQLLTLNEIEPTEENVINFIRTRSIPTENPQQTDIEQ